MGSASVRQQRLCSSSKRAATASVWHNNRYKDQCKKACDISERPSTDERMWWQQACIRAQPNGKRERRKELTHMHPNMVQWLLGRERLANDELRGQESCRTRNQAAIARADSSKNADGGMEACVFQAQLHQVSRRNRSERTEKASVCIWVGSLTITNTPKDHVFAHLRATLVGSSATTCAGATSVDRCAGMPCSSLCFYALLRGSLHA